MDALLRAVFAARAVGLSAAAKARAVRASLDVLSLRDVGYATPVRVPPRELRHRQIYRDASISLELFELGKGAVLPLHDHPAMGVVSRVMAGSLRALQFDR